MSISSSSVLDRPLVVVTGKGGAGKTTVAAALGLAAAERGRRTVVCELGRGGAVTAALGIAANGRSERAIAPGLWTLAIDPDAALAEWLRKQIPGPLAGLLSRSETFSTFVAAAPGARELVTATKAWELCQPDRWQRGARPYDQVILDAPATGHALGLLRAPRTFAEITRAGPVAKQARRVAEDFEDPETTAIVAVATPGELPVSEALEFEPAIAACLGRGVDAAVINGVYPRRSLDGVGGANGALKPGTPGAGALVAARSRVQRQRGQRRQLERLRRGMRAPVVTLPFKFAPALGRAEIEDLAERLRRGLDRAGA